MTSNGKFSPYWDEDKMSWGEIENIIEGYKRNVELMAVTQQIAIETTKSVIQLQTQYMKHAFDQLSSQAKHGLSPNVNDDQSEFGKATVDSAVQHATKINTILTKSNEKIIENVQKRFKEGLEESAATVKKAKSSTKKYRK